MYRVFVVAYNLYLVCFKVISIRKKDWSYTAVLIHKIIKLGKYYKWKGYDQSNGFLANNNFRFVMYSDFFNREESR